MYTVNCTLLTVETVNWTLCPLHTANCTLYILDCQLKTVFMFHCCRQCFKALHVSSKLFIKLLRMKKPRRQLHMMKTSKFRILGKQMTMMISYLYQQRKWMNQLHGDHSEENFWRMKVQYAAALAVLLQERGVQQLQFFQWSEIGRQEQRACSLENKFNF